MDGLECSEVKLSEAVGLTGARRFDSEYFKREYVSNQELIEQKGYKFFEGYCNSVRKGIFDLSPSFYRKEGVPFIRTSEIKNPLINFDSTVFIDKTVHMNEFNTALNAGDLVFTKIGANIGDVAMLPHKFTYYNFSQNVAGVSIKEKEHSAFLLAFFLSKYGRSQIVRSMMLSGQGKLELADIRKYEIPNVSKTLHHNCMHIIGAAENIMTEATKIYADAENTLTTNLSFNLSEISTRGTAEKCLSASFGTSGRLDAEYYQPKYDDLFAALSKLYTKPLGQIVNVTKSIEPGSLYYGSEGIPFIRVSDVSTMGIDAPSIKIPKNTVPSIETLYPRKDTILFSKDGSVGIAYKMEEDIEAVTSGALLHFHVKNTKEVLPDYLTLVLNSEVVQLQAERDSSGAIIQHWKPSDIEKVIIPILPINVQQKISENVQESFSLRRQAEKLIQTAVKAVEIAIETD